MLSATVDGEDVGRRADEAARLVWRNHPVRIDTLQVDLRSRGSGELVSRTYSRQQLADRFGPRPDGLNHSVADVAARVGIPAALLVLAVGLVLLLAVGAIVLLVLRATGRRSTVAR